MVAGRNKCQSQFRDLRSDVSAQPFRSSHGPTSCSCSRRAGPAVELSFFVWGRQRGSSRACCRATQHFARRNTQPASPPPNAFAPDSPAAHHLETACWAILTPARRARLIAGLPQSITPPSVRNVAGYHGLSPKILAIAHLDPPLIHPTTLLHTTPSLACAPS